MHLWTKHDIQQIRLSHTKKFLLWVNKYRCLDITAGRWNRVYPPTQRRGVLHYNMCWKVFASSGMSHVMVLRKWRKNVTANGSNLWCKINQNKPKIDSAGTLRCVTWRWFMLFVPRFENDFVCTLTLATFGFWVWLIQQSPLQCN